MSCTVKASKASVTTKTCFSFVPFKIENLVLSDEFIVSYRCTGFHTFNANQQYVV